MLAVTPCPIPDGALLRRYVDDGAYTDCYATDLPGSVPHARYVSTFYTTRVFKLERLILKLAASKPSTDAEAKQLATGSIDTFAAWHVEARREDQLLLCDFHGRTRSWLMVAPLLRDGTEHTRLYFGSAVVRVTDRRIGAMTLGPGFRALLGFHRLYSKVLLSATRSRLEARR